MKLVLFYHSFVSCWNHGNAHFLRGVARELVRLDHDVTVYEPRDGWSRSNALQDNGAQALQHAAQFVPGVKLRQYGLDQFDVEQSVEHADVVLVHEWTDPALVDDLGRTRSSGGNFTLLFHDTHHRAVTAPDELERFTLDGYDGVLAFGEVLREVYLRKGWGRQVFTWHEAADTAMFRPLAAPVDTDLIWIGNWGDDERAKELSEFLIEPASKLGLETVVHGVRYPDSARRELLLRGIKYKGWLPNHQVPAAFARARFTVHVPRRPYAEMLRGIPTIRIFEALACGIPLVSAPWDDAEHLFPEGSFLKVKNGDQMTAALSTLMSDKALALSLAHTGLNAIRARHTCAHRVQELFNILDRLGASSLPYQKSAHIEQVVVA
jgi:spore maturation protein CgeB